jgi:hypothetical protein
LFPGLFEETRRAESDMISRFSNRTIAVADENPNAARISRPRLAVKPILQIMHKAKLSRAEFSRRRRSHRHIAAKTASVNYQSVMPETGIGTQVTGTG